MKIPNSSPPQPAAATPQSLARPGSARAAAAAGQFGAATVQQIQAVDAAVVALLADVASSQGTPSEELRNRGERPQLRRPDTARLMRAAAQQAGNSGTAPRMTPEAAAAMFVLLLSVLLTEESSTDAKQRLEVLQSRLALRVAQGERISEAVRVAQANVDAAMGPAHAAAGELSAAVDALNAAKAEVARLEAELAGAPPEEQDAIRARLQAAQAGQAGAQARVDSASLAVQHTAAALNTAMLALESVMREADAFDPPGTPPRNPEGVRTNDARLGELLALLQEIIGKANDRKLEAEIKLVVEVLKAREAENVRRSVEYQEELEKADRAQKKMGCIGKIVGWVLTVVAVVAAPFTGGASMVLAGIGLALAIGEELGLDIMGKLLDPVMKLIMKAVKAMGDVIGSVLKSLGVSEALVDKMKDALGAIAVAAIIIATVFVSKKLAGTLAVQAIGKQVMRAVANAVSKALPQMLKSAGHLAKQSVDDVAKAITRTAAKVTGSSADNLAVRAGQAAKASQALQFANQTSQSVGTIVVANMYVNAAQLLADLELGLADAKIFRDLMQKIFDQFVATSNLVEILFRQMVDVQEADHEAARFITARVARA
ncbi:type III secretion system translocon subunit SctE [Stenotrophomonas sp.]|uniref:type III secretion system translocon subunit SctE n=1 Tax=Stenotrophomonas sp. TaxID=69392 RepID=UPI002FCA1EBF